MDKRQIYERTRELGMLRAVGMSRRQVKRMVRFEACILYPSDAADDLPCVDLAGRRTIKKKTVEAPAQARSLDTTTQPAPLWTTLTHPSATLLAPDLTQSN